MKKRLYLLLIIFLPVLAYTQDIFYGKWQLQTDVSSAGSINIHLQIGESEKGILYPARLNFNYKNFSGSYDLLLTKRNSRQLSISKNKYPINESPFSLNNNTLLLNGTLDFSKDLKGNPQLTLSRISGKKIGIALNKISTSTTDEKKTAEEILSLLESAEMVFKNVQREAWSDSNALKILKPRLSPVYFGLTDTIFVHSKEASIIFDNNKDNDIITVQNNGNNIIDQVDSKKSREAEDFNLDTGLNIITFFTDDFGKNPPSTASIGLQLEKSTRQLSFKDNDNFGGSVMAIKVYYQYNKEDFEKFESGPTGIDVQKLYNSIAFRAPAQDSGLKRNGKLVGSITSHTQQLTFAIWDDAVEDGDTVSLNINGKWITRGFPVLKKPQYITVILQPGPNLISFIADNLGSIVPNTSVIEIIDGKKRKSFFIETDLYQNNLVNIYYDVKPD